MPKKIYIPENAKYDGINVEWTKSTGTLYISGWYDGCVGISGEKIKLEDFFSRLGITEKDCRKALARLTSRAADLPPAASLVESNAKAANR